MDLQTLTLQSAEDIDLNPFGWCVGIGANTALTETAFYSGSVQLCKPGEFISDDDTTLSVARVQPRTNEVVWMERHFKHTQVFVPLGGNPYVVVLAPPNDKEVPDLDAAIAVQFPGHLGFMMRIGTWHEFPFAMQNPVDMIVVLRHETNRDLDQLANDEAEGEDLQKRNIKARLGVTLGFDLPTS
jgi:ureidoglycolate lyase